MLGFVGRSLVSGETPVTARVLGLCILRGSAFLHQSTHANAQTWSCQHVSQNQNARSWLVRSSLAGLQRRRWSCCHHAVSRTSNSSVLWTMLVFAPAPPLLPQRRHPHTASLKMPSRDKARHQAWQWLPHKALCCIQMLKQQEKSARARMGAGEAKPGMQVAWWSGVHIGHRRRRQGWLFCDCARHSARAESVLGSGRRRWERR